MNNAALSEAKGWYDRLMNLEFKGRGDREKSVRGRLAKRTGIPESYLYRLQYKFTEMKEVAGSAYRALMIDYHNLCERNEAAADRYRNERLGLRGHHEAADQELNEAVMGAIVAGLGSQAAHPAGEA